MSFNLTNPEKPIKIEFDNMDKAEEIMDYLSANGALVGTTLSLPSPVKKHFDAWLNAKGTTPTGAVVTSKQCDDKADGLTVYFYDSKEIESLRKRLPEMTEATATSIVRICR